MLRQFATERNARELCIGYGFGELHTGWLYVVRICWSNGLVNRCLQALFELFTETFVGFPRSFRSESNRRRPYNGLVNRCLSPSAVIMHYRLVTAWNQAARMWMQMESPHQSYHWLIRPVTRKDRKPANCCSNVNLSP